jgi:HAD superfamily hydrolase (TIGR01484 family)
MKKKYKALILDLDGTTIPNRRYGLPSKKVIDAIMKAHEKVFVCIATGRPLHQALPILAALQIKNPVILLGGSQIIEGSSKDFIYERPFLLDDVITLLPMLKPYHNQIVIDEKTDKIEYFVGYKPKEVFNLLIRNLSEKTADEIINTISPIKTITAHKIISWEAGEVVVNISHAEATKQHAIYEVAKLLRIDTHEIIGVGDGYNDFPLLMACGLKVAMGNAVPELKSIADYIAPTVEEDGVADVIEKFIL